MTINQYQQDAMRTANPDNPMAYGMLVNGAMGLCGEAGEVVDIVKKFLFQGHDLSREHLAEELGDVAWYLAVTAYSIGYDLESVLAMNVEKRAKRYPQGFDRDHSVHRAEYKGAEL